MDYVTTISQLHLCLWLSYCIRLLLGWPRVVDHTLLLHFHQRRSDGFAHRLNSLSFRLGVAPGQACYLPRRPAQRFPRQSAPRHLPFLFLLHCAVAEKSFSSPLNAHLLFPSFQLCFPFAPSLRKLLFIFQCAFWIAVHFVSFVFSLILVSRCFRRGLINHTSRSHPARGLINRVLG